MMNLLFGAMVGVLAILAVEAIAIYVIIIRDRKSD